MRIGIVAGDTDWSAPATLLDEAAAVERSGLDLYWLEESHDRPGALPAPLVVASALGAVTTSLAVGVTVQAGALHPVTLAEEATVADLALGGRLAALALSPVPGLGDALGEVIALLYACFSPRPFRHAGERWQVPANLPQNVHGVEASLRVAPAGSKLDLPLFSAGCASAPVAAEYGVAVLALATEDDGEAAGALQLVAERLGHAAGRLRRPAVRSVPVEAGSGRVEVEALVGTLRSGQQRFGLDTALLRLPESLGPARRARAIEVIAHLVRPRVQLDRLPDGLAQHWAEDPELAALAAARAAAGPAGASGPGRGGSRR